MEGSGKLILHLQNVSEILRSPGKSYRKRMITGDAEHFIIEQAENLPRKEAINIVVHSLLPENEQKDEIEMAIHKHFRYRKEQSENKIAMLIHESFVIFAWVALWRPIEVLLYDWYPIKRDINLYRRLEESNVQVVYEPDGSIMNLK